MRTFIRYSLLSTTIMAALGVVSAPAIAKTTLGDAEISANIGVVSDYSFRGISQSNENFALQGGFDVTHESGFYAGFWGSNIDYNNTQGGSIETDLYAGYSGTVGKLAYDVGVLGYYYPGADSSLNYDYYEGSLAVGYDFDVASVSTSVNVSPNYFGDSGTASYFAGAVDVPVTEALSLSAHAGRQYIERNARYGTPDYTDWSLGANYDWQDYSFGVQYVDTNMGLSECADNCAPRVVFSVSTSW